MKHYDEAVAQFVQSGTMNPDSSLPRGVKKLLQSLSSPVNQSFSRELWEYNLRDRISKINEPILVVLGKKDIQVNWKIDGKELETATSQNEMASFSYPENANHLLKHEEKPREKLDARYVGRNYNTDRAVLDQDAMDVISD